MDNIVNASLLNFFFDNSWSFYDNQYFFATPTICYVDYYDTYMESPYGAKDGTEISGE